MNTKNLDAIKRMVVRLQAIKETDFLVLPTVYNISTAMECLQEVIDTYDDNPPSKNTEEVRTD